MQETLSRLIDKIGEFLPNILAAIAILVAGWLVALALAAIVRGIINRIAGGRHLKKALETGEEREPPPLGKWTGRIVFYLLMAFVLTATFRSLQLFSISEPLDRMLQDLMLYLPKLVGAALLLVVAWLLGTVLRFLIAGALSRTSLDKKVAEHADLGEHPPISKTLGDIVFWLVLLLFLPAILGVLELQGLLMPLQGMFDDLLGILPNIIGTAFILLLGWFIARILRQIVTALLDTTGFNRLGDKIGMGTDAGPRRLSAVIGLVVYTLILIPAIVAALDALQIESISQPATMMLQQLMTAIPVLFGATILLGMAVLVGKVISGLVARLLAGLGFDSLFQKLGLIVVADKDRQTPSQIAGHLTQVAIVLMAAIEAARLLGFESLASLVVEFFEFGSRLLLGLVIFGVGLYLGNLAHRAIPRREGPWGGIYAEAARGAIVVLATAMALQQTGVAQEIVTLAFALVLGAIAVAAAIAFGIGSHKAAGDMVEDWLKRFQKSKD